MPQSNVIFAFVFVAFLIFITARGELSKYAAVFLGGDAGGQSKPSTDPAERKEGTAEKIADFKFMGTDAFSMSFDRARFQRTMEFLSGGVD